MIAAALRSGLVLGIFNAGWSSLLSFLALPFYLRHFGVEAYGLVGFAATLQGVLGLLDLGLTPAVNREVARLRALGDQVGAADTVYSLSWVFWPVSLVAGVIVAAAAPAIAHHWIQNAVVPEKTVTTCVILMGVTFAVRLPGSIYNNALLGAGRLNLVSGISLLTGTLSTGGTVLLILFCHIDIVGLFVWQGLVSAAIVAILVFSVAVIVGRPAALFPSLAPLRRVWRFSVGMGVTAIIGVAFNYVDRLVLSGVVSLRAFGGYSLALAIAKLVSLIVGPTHQFLFPRLTTMHVADDAPALRQSYYGWASLLGCVLIACGVYLTLYAGDLVLLISGSQNLARTLPPVIAFLTWGTVLNGIMYFPYTLQMAVGRSKLAAGIAFGLLIGYIPIFITLLRLFGMVGAAAAWFAINLIYLFVGTWLTHRQLLAELPWKWLVGSVGVPLAMAVVVGGLVWAGVQLTIGSLPIGPIVGIVIGGLAVPLTVLALLGCSRSARAAVFPAAVR